jgi:hypothetical protein
MHIAGALAAGSAGNARIPMSVLDAGADLRMARSAATAIVVIVCFVALSPFRAYKVGSHPTSWSESACDHVLALV